MDFLINKNNIIDALLKIQGITGRNTNLAITSDILINASSSNISITANNLETVFLGEYEAQVKSEGIITINSNKFFEIIKEYPFDNIPVKEIENRWVEIGEGDTIYNIVSSNYENFPQTPVIEDINFIDINCSDIKKMVDVTSSISYTQDEKRMYMLGVLVEKADVENIKKLRVVSTDSKRLHCYEFEYSGEIEFPQENILIPKKAFSEIGKFVLNKSGNIQFGLKDNHVIVSKDQEILMIKLFDGEYPDYTRLLNTDSMIPINIEKNMFNTMLRRLSILTSEQYKSIILRFENNEMQSFINNPEIGDFKDKLKVDYEGDKIESAFNPKYFMDAVKIIENENLVLYIKDKESPFLVKGLDNDKLVCIIMAMKIL
jgi:DNA polymerase III subunit beta